MGVSASMTGCRVPACPLLLLLLLPALHADPEHHYLVKPKGEPGYQLLKLEKPLDMESINKDLGVAEKASEPAADTADAGADDAAADAPTEILDEEADTDNDGDYRDYMNEGDDIDNEDEDEYDDLYDEDDDDNDEKELEFDAGHLDIAEGLKSVDEFFEEDGEAGSDYMDGDPDSEDGETEEYYLIP